MRLFHYPPSGNGYKVRLLLAQLSLPYDEVHVDVLKGEARTPEFLARNPEGRTPVLEIADGQFLPESNAILLYLAEGTPFLPAGRLERARVNQWLFFEQYSHEPNLATSRFWMLTGRTAGREAFLADKRERGLWALGVMERHLSGQEFFAAGRYTVADIALFAYTQVAPEGGFALEPFPAVRAWLDRVRAQPGWIPWPERYPTQDGTPA